MAHTMPQASTGADTFGSSSKSPASLTSLASYPVESVPEQPAAIFVAGSLAVDFSCDFAPSFGSTAVTPDSSTSNPAIIRQSLGGVGYNVARAASLMGSNVRLCTAIGEDLSGIAAIDSLHKTKMSIKGIEKLPEKSGARTAQYVAVNDKRKDLVLAMADMDILGATNTALTSIFDQRWLPQLKSEAPSVLAFDGNWHPQHILLWLSGAKDASSMVVFEPVSRLKSTSVFRTPVVESLATFPAPSIHLATPNLYELAAMHATARESGALDRQDWWEVIDALGIPSAGARAKLAMATDADLVDSGIPQQSIQLLPFIPTICTKLGEKGVLLTQIIRAGDPRLTSAKYAPYILSRCNNGTEDSLGVGGVYMRLFPAVEKVADNEIVSVNGVGDTFAGTLLAVLAKHGRSARLEEWIDLAQKAAVLSLKCEESVNPAIAGLRAQLL